MLSIGAMGSGQAAYYIGLAREDYYLDGGEPPGLWHGQGVHALGLSGTVSGEALTRLFAGYHPRSDTALVELQNGKEHRPGWDLTFSAPKSLSVVWSQADPQTRKAIEDAQFEAVKAALSYLEETCEVARRGKGGQHHELGKLIFATFEHGTSRAQDPQLHTHCLLMNTCLRTDGTFGTLDSEAIFKAKMAAGALYRAEFSKQLEDRPGIEVRRDGIYFEAKGVSQKLCDEFSKRRGEIEQALGDKGMQSAQAAAIAALNTRNVKGHASREELFQEWGKTGKEFGWSREQAQELLGKRIQHPAENLSQAVTVTTQSVTEQHSYFTEREFTRRLAEECQGRGIGAAEILAATKEHLSNSEQIVFLGHLKGAGVYTTREMMALETQLLTAIEQSRESTNLGVSKQAIEGIISTRRSFSEEQAQALRHITEEGASIRVVSGMAGTGKTTLLHAARLSWELAGYEVRGAALAGSAAEGLEHGSGIESATIHRTLMDLKSGKLTLDNKSVLVIDEAGMVGTRLMKELVETTHKAGAALILVGDAGQIQSIQAGGAFAEIKNRLGSSDLKEIRRQHEPWARQAVLDFAAGRARKGLNAYAERGQLHISEEQGAVHQALISHWKTAGVYNPKDQLIFAGTRKDATILNHLAQDERKRVGELSSECVFADGSHFHVGDRILFTRNSSTYDVRNGTLGQVTQIDPERRRLSVRTDKGHQVNFSLEDYDHIKLGYAMTTHKGQGATVERAYVLAGGTMQDREITYVQASRSHAETQLFADRETAGEGAYRLVKQMSASRAKEMAHAVTQRAEQETSSRQTNKNEHAPRLSF